MTLKYIIKRLIYIVFVFFVISIVQFGIYKAIPGDPARMMVDGSKTSLSPVQYEQLYQQTRIKLGLDKPIYIQYVSFMARILQGDFGYSMQYRRPVVEVIAAPMRNTIFLNIFSIFLIPLITIPLGISTAVRKKSLYDNTVQVFTILGYSLPGFIFAILFIFLFSVKLRWLPISGMNSPGFTGSDWAMFLDRLKYVILPVLTIVFSSLGTITRYVRATMIDALSMDYIRTARAKGLKEKVVVYSHAFRNSLIPFVAIITGLILSLFSGSLVIESIFGWNGMGKIMIDSLRQLDFAVVLAMQLFYVLIALVGNLIMDICYVLVDPRVKLG